MKTIQEWAEYYYNVCKVWVYTGNQVFKWIDWRNMSDKDYLNKVQSYDWAKGKFLMVVLGKKGLRAIQIKWKYKTAVPDILKLLGLYVDYPWVYNEFGNIWIIIDTPNTVVGGIDANNDCFKLIWEGSIHIPYEERSSKDSLSFISNIPKEHPTQISNDKLRECIKKLSKAKYWKKYEKKEDEESNKRLAEWIHNPETKKNGCGCMTFLLMIIVCAILGVGSDNSLDAGTITIGIICIVALFLVGAFITGAFKDKG